MTEDKMKRMLKIVVADFEKTVGTLLIPLNA
jgi:hypothetical protein